MDLQAAAIKRHRSFRVVCLMMIGTISFGLLAFLGWQVARSDSPTMFSRSGLLLYLVSGLALISLMLGLLVSFAHYGLLMIHDLLIARMQGIPLKVLFSRSHLVGSESTLRNFKDFRSLATDCVGEVMDLVTSLKRLF